MAATLLISERGQVTLPARIRKKYALNKNTHLVLEETKQGLLLRKASVVPLHQYSEDEIQQWLKADKILSKDKKWLK